MNPAFRAIRHPGENRDRGALVLPTLGHFPHASGAGANLGRELLNQIADSQRASSFSGGAQTGSHTISVVMANGS